MAAEPSEAFETLAHRVRGGAGDETSIADAALTLAAEFKTDVDRAEAERALSTLAERATERLAHAPPGEGRIRALVEALHVDAGLRGNEESYQDARNSFIDVVLERRLGIPITLALVYIEVGARVGVPIEGISFPQHFLVRCSETRCLIDPFHGRILRDEECQARLVEALGPDAHFDPDELRAATTREILVRMLTNLKHVFLGERKLEEALACSSRILLLAPEVVSELRDRGLLYEALECFRPALADLERFLALAPKAPGAEAVRRRIERVRARVRTIH